MERASAAAVALTDTPLARCLANHARPSHLLCPRLVEVGPLSRRPALLAQNTAGVTVCSQVSCCRSRQPTRHNTSGCAIYWVLVVAEHLPAAEETGEEAHLR
jgi:hypothetical protein